MEATVTPTTDVVLKGTVYVRLYYYYGTSSKYIVPLNLTVTGDLVADKTVASTTTTLTGVAVNGTAISDDNLNTLVTTKSLTLADKYLDAPSVVFTKTTTTTYDDNTTSTTTDDETVVATKGTDAYTATTTIGDDTYTVSLGVDKSAGATVDVESFALVADKADIASQVIKITGYNITDPVTVTIPEVDGLTVTPTELTLTDGEAQTITVSYQSDIDVASTSATVTFASGETTLATVPFTYSSTAAVVEVASVSEAQSWDFTKAGSSDIKSPRPSEMVCMANASGFADGFNYAALAAQGTYFFRKSNTCWQGRTIRFVTTVPGTVKVSFSNTGSGQNRSVKINDNVACEAGASGASKNAATAEYAVEAGEVVITGYNVADETGADVRIYSMTFTPSVATVAVSDAGLASYCSSKALDFSEVTDVEAYVATSYKGNVVSMTKVTQVPAGTGIIVKSVSGGSAFVNVPYAESATAIETNLLVGVTEEPTTVAASTTGSYNYIFSNGANGVGFYRLSADHVLVPGKAYLHTTEDLVGASEAKGVVMSFGGETTGITSIQSADAANGAYYTISGVRVANPTKGLYIKDGKKVIIK